MRRKTEVNEGGWSRLKDNIIVAEREVCGETTGQRRKEKETWRWNVAVHQALKDKRVVYKTWQRTKEEEDRALYPEKKRHVKKKAATAKQEAWER